MTVLLTYLKLKVRPMVWVGVCEECARSPCVMKPCDEKRKVGEAIYSRPEEHRRASEHSMMEAAL